MPSCGPSKVRQIFANTSLTTGSAENISCNILMRIVHIQFGETLRKPQETPNCKISLRTQCRFCSPATFVLTSSFVFYSTLSFLSVCRTAALQVTDMAADEPTPNAQLAEAAAVDAKSMAMEAFTGDEDPTASALSCYYSNCKYNKGCTWLKMLEHVRTQHLEGSWASIAGTPLHTKGSAEHNVKQSARYHKRKENGGAKRKPKDVCTTAPATKLPKVDVDSVVQGNVSSGSSGIATVPLAAQPSASLAGERGLGLSEHDPTRLNERSVVASPQIDQSHHDNATKPAALLSVASKNSSVVPSIPETVVEAASTRKCPPEQDAPSLFASGSPTSGTSLTSCSRKHTWRKMTCWVKCSLDGIPVLPLEATLGTGPCEFRATSATTDAHCRGEESSRATVPDPPKAAQGASSHDSAYVPAQESPGTQLCHATPLDTSAESRVAVAPLLSGYDMMAKMCSMLEQQLNPDKRKWLETLPKLCLKKSYTDREAPAAKGEEGCMRADWPKELRPAEVPGFNRWLENKENKKLGRRTKLCQGVGRVLNSLELAAGQGDSSADLDICSVECLVAFFTQGIYQQYLDLAIMQPKYSWPLTTLDGLAAYCTYHIRELTRRILMGDSGPLSEYKTALGQLLDELTGGCRKRCIEHCESSLRAKCRQDLKDIKNMPKVAELQKGVLEGYALLRKAAAQYSGCSSMPGHVRARCNAAIVGGVWFDTFGGRKMEWEILLFSDVMKVLEAGDDHIVMHEHKTSAVYGDLAKFLTPGLIEALRAYASLPRPEGVLTFLVPAKAGTGRVDIPSAMRTFARCHLPKSRSRPTVNLVRKWFHRHLISMTDSKEKLKEVMQIIDAHSTAVIDRHYYLRDAADDVKLARMLVKAVLGETVAWPSAADATSIMEGRDWLAADLEEVLDEGTSSEDVDDEEVGLEWWPEAGTFFGVKTDAEELAALTDGLRGAAETEQPIASTAVSVDASKDASQRGKGAGSSSTGDSAPTATSIDVKKDASQRGNCGDSSSNEGSASRQNQAPRASKPSEGSTEGHGSIAQCSPHEVVLTKEDRELLKKHKYVKPLVPGGPKMLVAPEGHAWMLQELKAWQNAWGLGALELPQKKVWYDLKRSQAIEKGLVSRLNSEDVVRSFLDGRIRKGKQDSL